jgi:hypothetical protein
MNRFKSIKKPLMWLMPLLLAALVTGCGGSSSSGIAGTTAPTVSSMAPVNGAVTVPINSKITATFSEAMTPATINAMTFTVATSAVPAVPVAGTVALDASNKIAVFTPPAGNFTASTPYNATITTGAKDKAGNALAAAKTWSFTTGTTADTIAPTVVSTSPADLATGVGINTDVTASFSEGMDPSTINNATFILKQGFSPVPGAVSYLSGIATFNPTNNLAANTTYIAAVTTGATDLAGNKLSATGDIKKWSFTTGTGTVVPPPVAAGPAGPAAVNLNTAGNFAILAEQGIAYSGPTGITAVTGDMGISPYAASFITGFALTVDCTNDFSTSAVVTGKIYAPGYTGGVSSPAGCVSNGLTPAKMTVAQTDLVNSYNDAAGRTPGVGATNLNLGGGTISGLTLVPGTYTWGTNVGITGNITLAGAATDVWIFQISGTLSQADATSILLSGGAMAKNVFWQVAGGVTLTGTAHMEGVIMSKTTITLNGTSTANSRLLAQTTVALAGKVTQPAP